jgi:hypothetical protein
VRRRRARGRAITARLADERFRTFAQLVERAVAKAIELGLEIGQGDGKCMCPNGAVALLAWTEIRKQQSDGFDDRYPVCDDSAVAYHELLGGARTCEWMDEAREFEVGFDGSDPVEECVSRRSRYYKLGVQYRQADGILDA